MNLIYLMCLAPHAVQELPTSLAKTPQRQSPRIGWKFASRSTKIIRYHWRFTTLKFPRSSRSPLKTWVGILMIFIWLWINTYENTMFSGMNIHKSQLFWCELQGYKVLTHDLHIVVMECHGLELEESIFFVRASKTAPYWPRTQWCWT